MTPENDQSVDISVVRQAAKGIGTPSASRAKRFTTKLSSIFDMEDVQEVGWGAGIGFIILDAYRSACRDLSDDREICEDARQLWDSDIMEDMEQRSNELLFDATGGIKNKIEDELSSVLRDIRNEARGVAEVLMWRALHQR